MKVNCNASLLKECAYTNLVYTLKEITDELSPSEMYIQTILGKVELAVDIYLKSSKQLQLSTREEQPQF